MKKLLVLCLLFGSVTNITFASQFGGYDAGSLNSQYVRDLRMHDSITRARSNSSAIINTKNKPSDVASKPLDQSAVSDIKSVIFINNSSIPSSELLNAIHSKINQPMNAENVAEIRKNIMGYYQSKGYYSAVAIINAQNASTGELIIEVKEGGKNSILIQQ